jgi:hypothetical protein
MDNKPGIDQLLVRSALDADLQRRLRETPDEVFRDYDLSPEEQEILRKPDHRLLPLLGAAIARQRPEAERARSEASATPANVTLQAQALPDIALALTIVPCARYENGEFAGFQYAAWVSPLPAGADPATLPPPAGAALPGAPSPPLYASINIAAVQLPDAAGTPQAAMWASLRQASNITAPPAAETAAKPHASPFGSDFNAPAVRDAAAAVRAAAPEDRYGRIMSLLAVLRTGEVR